MTEEYRTGVNGQVIIDPNEILGIERDTDPNDEGVSVLLWPGRWRIRARSMGGGGGSAGGSTGSTAWADITGKPSSFPPSAHQHPAGDVTDFTEATQDVVGSMIVGAGGTYDDAAGTITLPTGGGGGGSSAVTADDTPAAPAEGESASYLVTSAVTWPAGLVWSTDPDGGLAPAITGTALVSMFTVSGVTRALLGATFPAATVPDTTAPSTVTGLTATATGPTTVDLAWSAATDNVGVTGYEYRIGGGAAVDAGAGTTETVTGLTAGTLYSFEVRAYDAAGNRSAAWSTAATATTTAPDTTPPVWTATLTPGTPTTTSVVVTASALATDANAITYERTLDSTAGTPVWAAIVPSGLNFTLDGLTAGTVYANCALRAKDAAGNISTPVLAVPSFTTAAAGGPSLADAILALNPVGYWKLDETAGTVAADSSGNSRPGTYSGAYTLASSDGAPTFSGGKVTIPDADDWTAAGATNGFSVFAIYRMAAVTTARQFIVAKGAQNQYEWGLENIENADTVEAMIWGPGGIVHANERQTGVPAATWHAVAVAMPNPATMGTRFNIYVDSGTPSSVSAVPNDHTAPANGTAPLIIGGRGDAVGPFGGSIRHVAIFRTRLSDANVGSLVEAARGEGLIP